MVMSRLGEQMERILRVFACICLGTCLCAAGQQPVPAVPPNTPAVKPGKKAATPTTNAQTHRLALVAVPLSPADVVNQSPSQDITIDFGGAYQTVSFQNT